MVRPARKFTPEEIAANAQATAERELKQEGISKFEAQRNRGSKRNRRNDNDEISVVSASKRPKALQGHNKFDEASYWRSPTRERVRSRPNEVYVPGNNIDSPASSIDSPMARTRRTLVSSSKDYYVGTRVCFRHTGMIFYGTVTRCFLNNRGARTWECVYDDGDEEELLAVGFYKRQKLYAQEGIYDPKGKAEQRAPPPPPKLPSKTKKDNTKKRKSVQKKTSTQTKKKTTKTKMKTTKKTDKTALPTPKLHDADGDTISTHGNYTPQRPYSYEVQYKDKSKPTYTPFVLKDHFLPKFRLPTGVIPSVAAMCNLSLPDSIIDGIVTRSNMYAMARTKLEESILVDGVMKRNPRWMHPSKYRDITRQDILFFFACYYYMGYCRLPAKLARLLGRT